MQSVKKHIKQHIIPIGIIGIGITTLSGFMIYKAYSGKRILTEAQKYIGQQEIKPNMGWVNKHFETLMKSVGWKQKDDYCVTFTKLILLKTLKGKRREFVKRYFTPSSQTTWMNLIKHKDKGLYKLSKKPKPGSIAFYKHMQKNWRGHADIVKKEDKDGFTVISANGSIGVEIKKRAYTYNSNTFRLLGFVNFN
jgi:hypothetical protein